MNHARSRGFAAWLAILLVSSTAGLAWGQSPSLSTDQPDYYPGQRVIITGAGWQPGEDVLLMLHESPRTHGERTLTAVADENGDVANADFAPELHDVGTAFTLVATGLSSGLTATTTFTDAGPQADLDQGRNGTASSSNDPVDMVNGNAGASNSHYLEGQSIPYRLVMTRLGLGAHNVKIEWDIRGNGMNALDYITHCQRLLPHTFSPSHSAETVNPLLGLGGYFGSPSTFAIPAPSSTGSPVPGMPGASFNALPAAQRVMTIYNGTITSLSYVSQGSLTANNSSTQLSIDFTAADDTVLIAWGGHIASAGDWGYGNSAGGISGSSYHTRLIELDGSGGNQDRSMSTQAVPAPPTCSVSGPESACSGSVNTYTETTDASNPTFAWSLVDDTSGASFVGGTTGSSVQVRAGSAGSYTVHVLVTAANGTSSCEVTSTVEAGPSANAGPDRDLCRGDSVQIGGAPTASGGTPGYAYSWSPATGLSSVSASNPTASPAGTTTYVVLVTDSNGCADRDSVAVTVCPNPSANAGPDRDICAGESVQIGGSPTASGGTPGYTYAWSPATGLSNASDPNPFASPTSTTTYFLLVTDARNCVARDSVVVTVNQAPAADAGPDQSVCASDGVQIGGNPTASGGTPGYVYSWSPATGLGNATAPNPTAQPTVTTTYVVRVTDSHGCVDRDTVLVTVNSSPVADAGSDKSVCSSSTAEIGGNPTASGGTPGYVYSWSPATGLSNATAPNPTAQPTVTTTYVVRVTDSHGCVDRDSVVVAVCPNPSANAGPDRDICAGESVQIGGSPTASGGTPGYTYAWSPATGLSNTGASNPFASPTSTTTYFLLVTDARNCVDRDTVVVVVHPNPVADAGPDQSICAGEKVKIGGGPTASGGTPGYAYSWSPAPGLSSTTDPNPKASPASSTIYVVLITDSKGCADRDTVVVSVNPSPTASAGPDRSVCDGASAQIGGSPTASGGTPGYIYSWTPPSGLNSATDPNPTATPTATTTYIVRVTDSHGCVDRDTVVVAVCPNPSANAGPDRDLCAGESVQIGGNPTASSGTPNYTYSWSPSTGLNSTSVANPMASPVVTTTYIVAVTDARDCVDRDTVVVTVHPNPVANAGPDRSICAGSSVQIGGSPTANGGTPGYAIKWSPSSGLSSTTAANPTASPAATTTYIVLVTDSHGCGDRDSVVVTVNPHPVADAGPDRSICSGSVQIGGNPTASGGTPGYSIQWSPSAGLSSTSDPNPNASPAVTTTYRIVVFDSKGCSASDSVTVMVEGALRRAGLLALQDMNQTANVDLLVKIPDPFTGVAQAIGSMGDHYIEAEALCTKPGSDKLYAVENNRIVLVNPSTGAGTDIGPIGYQHVDGLAFHPKTGVLYGITWDSNKLLKIDPKTGKGKVVASHVLEGHRLNDLAFHPDGRAFVISDDLPPILYQISISSGEKKKKWVLSGGSSMEALLWSEDGGTLYSTSDRGKFKDLVTIDLSTKKVTFVSATLHSGFNDVEGLAWYHFEAPCTPPPAKAELASPWTAPLRLYQNTPNPFNPTTRIAFDLPQAGDVDVSVFDVRGRLVALLVRGPVQQGHHEVLWSGETSGGGRAASGTYFYTLRTPSGTETKRMVLLK